MDSRRKKKRRTEGMGTIGWKDGRRGRRGKQNEVKDGRGEAVRLRQERADKRKGCKCENVKRREKIYI